MEVGKIREGHIICRPSEGQQFRLRKDASLEMIQFHLSEEDRLIQWQIQLHTCEEDTRSQAVV